MRADTDTHLDNNMVNVFNLNGFVFEGIKHIYVLNFPYVSGLTPEVMKVIGGVCLQFEWQYGQRGENIVLWFTALTSNFFLYQPPIILVECEVIHLDQNSKRM